MTSSFLLRAASVPDLKNLKLDRWHDPSTDNWNVMLKDSAGNQHGDTIVVYTRREAMNIKKDHPGFNLRDMDAENEQRYGSGRPQLPPAKPAKRRK